MDRPDLQAIIESLLFVVDEPLTRDRLYSFFADVDGADIEEAIEQLKARYDRENSGVEVREIAGGVQMRTRAACDEYIREFLLIKKRTQLSRQALETLAIVAYEQPVSTPEIKEIRGMDPSGVIRTLLQRKLIRVTGRKDVIGRPFTYGTTKEFLIQFGLRSLEDLPKAEDFGALLEGAAGEYSDEDRYEANGSDLVKFED